MRKRTHLRGVLFGVIAHVSLALIFAYVGVQLTRVASLAAGIPNPLKTGPFEPLSVGWYFTQPLVVILGGIAGFTAAHFSPARSWISPSILAGGTLLLAFWALPSSHNLFVLAAWLALSPIGILLGAHTYMQRVSERDA